MVRPKYLPVVEKMLGVPGLYVLHNPRNRSEFVPIFSTPDGELYPIRPDVDPLNPASFNPVLILEGPILPLSTREDLMPFNDRIELNRSMLRAIRDSLPQNRDWLDPILENHLRRYLDGKEFEDLRNP